MPFSRHPPGLVALGWLGGGSVNAGRAHLGLLSEVVADAVLVAPEASSLTPVGVLAAVDADLCFG